MSGISPPAPETPSYPCTSPEPKLPLAADAFRHRQPKIGLGALVNETPFPTTDITVTKYATRHWAVWRRGELVAVTPLPKGREARS